MADSARSVERNTSIDGTYNLQNPDPRPYSPSLSSNGIALFVEGDGPSSGTPKPVAEELPVRTEETVALQVRALILPIPSDRQSCEFYYPEQFGGMLNFKSAML